jgi:uncharacterized protein
VIAVDANLLIYASVKSLPQHEAAHRWLDRQLNEASKVGLPWSSLLAFVRLVTNPRLFRSALSIQEAWEQVETWLALPSVWIPHPELLGALLRVPGMKSNSVPDAHLAALAIEHNLTLCSSDAGFSSFADLSLENPLS